MGRFIPGSEFFAFDPSDWEIYEALFAAYITSDTVEEYTYNGKLYHLVPISDLYEDEADILNDGLTLESLSIATFMDSVQAFIQTPDYS